jgi:single-strand DNA-binding protein
MSTNTKNSVTLTGNLGSTPETSELAGGKKVEKTSWFNLTFWNDKADLAAKLQKGDFVQVNGKLASTEYTDKEGTKRYGTEIIVFEVKKIEKADREA